MDKNNLKLRLMDMDYHIDSDDADSMHIWKYGVWDKNLSELENLELKVIKRWTELETYIDEDGNRRLAPDNHPMDNFIVKL